jgi:carbon storage regulator
MLVLSRKLGERLWIGPNICITVTEIDRGKIRIGVEAPKDVNVTRSELGRPKCEACHGAGCEGCAFGEQLAAFHKSKGA